MNASVDKIGPADRLATVVPSQYSFEPPFRPSWWSGSNTNYLRSSHGSQDLGSHVGFGHDLLSPANFCIRALT